MFKQYKYLNLRNKGEDKIYKQINRGEGRGERGEGRGERGEGRGERGAERGERGITYIFSEISELA